jgi:two-component system nitrogen regulation response regulator NtrX
MLPINYQQKLLLALENNKLFKNYKIYLKQKIISLSNKNIKDEIKKGNFIKNLYERLSTIKIEIPEINNRREDIVPICEYYLGYYNQNKKYKFSFSQNAKTKLELYHWPGNISQIINYAQKTIILNHELNNNSNYEIENLPMDMGDYEQKHKIENSFDLSLKEARNNFERNYFISQIQRFNGNISKISNFTGMERTALYRKFKSLNINIENN